jgi:DNA-binding response OmpR family regulator
MPPLEENRCLENGMNDYLSKPFHFNVLLENYIII